jgi:hypothetical protein
MEAGAEKIKMNRIAPALCANAWALSKFRTRDYDSPLRRQLPGPAQRLQYAILQRREMQLVVFDCASRIDDALADLQHRRSLAAARTAP